MKWKEGVAVSVALGVLVVLQCAGAQDAKPATPAGAGEAKERDLCDVIKHPVPWFLWGADARIREEYVRNAVTLTDDVNDTTNAIRTLYRLWVQLGPFLQDESLTVPNGLTFYARMAYEPRYFIQSPHGTKEVQWNEIILDNLYADLQRPGGWPFGIKVGRQDMTYGRGWVILDGTPLDGARSIYSDAIKGTLYFDEMYKSSLDLFAIDNKGKETRLKPLNNADVPVSEFNSTIVGAYFISKYAEGHEANAYYIYKDEQPLTISSSPRATVHTLGGLAQGKFPCGFDYYAEGAGQWGRNGSADQENAWGMNSEIGYAIPQCPWSTRVHAGYEYLSGDDPNTGKYEGWDPVMARWPQWSELFAYRWALETGQPGHYTNLQRLNVGAGVQPTKKLRAEVDYHYLLANEHTAGNPPGAGPGLNRGQLLAARAFYTFNKYVDAHLWLEYFLPGDYYARSADNAMFFRWEVTFKF